MTETSGTTITDIKGGVVWNVGGVGATLDFSEPYAVEVMRDDSADPALVTSGTWAVLSSAKKIVVLAAGVVSDAVSSHVRLAIGDSNNILGFGAGGIGMAGEPFHSSMKSSGGATGVFQTAITVPNPARPIVPEIPPLAPVDYHTTDYNGQHHALLLKYTGGRCLDGGYSARDIDTWGAVIETNFVFDNELDETTSYVPVTWDAAGGLQMPAAMRFSGMKLYGYAIFEFDELPANFESACHWTVQQWKQGKKIIHSDLL